MTHVPFFDRTRGDKAIEEDLVAAFRRVIESGRYILGHEVKAFEDACAAILGSPHTIGVSSCTDALLLSMTALGIEPGDEVICPAYTFFATAGAVARLGARPVFADVKPDCLTLDPDDVTRRITPKTKGILAVHLFGLCADLPALSTIARDARLWLIEDCAQAMGAQQGGRRAGTTGAFGCFSFFPTKNLGGFGDGGLITTSNPALAALTRGLRTHGARTKHNHDHIGGNFRLDALQAALLGVKLRGFDAAIARRRELAALYDRLFLERGLAVTLAGSSDEAENGAIELGARPADHTFNQYTIRAPGRAGDTRDRLRAFLDARGIGTEVYYPVPLPLQRALAWLGHAVGDFPVAEAASRETLALPIFPELTDNEITCVVDQIEAFYREVSSVRRAADRT